MRIVLKKRVGSTSKKKKEQLFVKKKEREMFVELFKNRSYLTKNSFMNFALSLPPLIQSGKERENFDSQKLF